ncbi:hypothetical protein ACP70R_046367 [Stipagrostis hirtigluma subsp. patula]
MCCFNWGDTSITREELHSYLQEGTAKSMKFVRAFIQCLNCDDRNDKFVSRDGTRAYRIIFPPMVLESDGVNKIKDLNIVDKIKAEIPECKDKKLKGALSTNLVNAFYSKHIGLVEEKIELVALHFLSQVETALLERKFSFKSGIERKAGSDASAVNLSDTDLTIMSAILKHNSPKHHKLKELMDDERIKVVLDILFHKANAAELPEDIQAIKSSK